MTKSKLKKLKQVLIGISTATFMSNKFKILLLDIIFALDCRCDNVCYFYLLHHHFKQNKKPGFCSINNCEIVFRMPDRSKNNLFMSFGHQGKLSFVFFHKDEFNSSDIHVFPILHDSRILSYHSIEKNLK